MKSEFYSSSNKVGYHIVGAKVQDILDFFKDSLYTIRVVESKNRRSKRPKMTIDVIVKDGIIAETLMY